MLMNCVAAAMIPFPAMSRGGSAAGSNGGFRVALGWRTVPVGTVVHSPFGVVGALATALVIAASPAAFSASDMHSGPVLVAQERRENPPELRRGNPPELRRGNPPETSGAEPLEGSDAGSGGSGPGAEGHDETLAALEAAILRLEGEIAELARLAEWQARLLSAARTDPIGARRQRRTRASCLKTPLAAWCDRLNGMYRDGDGMAASGVNDKTSRRTVQ